MSSEYEGLESTNAERFSTAGFSHQAIAASDTRNNHVCEKCVSVCMCVCVSVCKCLIAFDYESTSR